MLPLGPARARLALVYVSGNVQLATFLNVMFLPGTGELTVFVSSVTAACFGFLWYNGYPATVFMGDTGSLALGGAIATPILMVRKELLLPLLGIVYVAEAVGDHANRLFQVYATTDGDRTEDLPDGPAAPSL